MIHSKNKDLILTAHHCVGPGSAQGAAGIFIPDYQQGKSAASQTYGFYADQKIYADASYSRNASTGPDSDVDYAFVRVSRKNDSPSGAQLEDQTGALTLKIGAGATNKNITIIGYPTSNHARPEDVANKAITCTVPTSPAPHYHQMQMFCGRYEGGVSGGPWIQDYNPNTHTGEVIGNVGGYNGGGDDDNHDWVSYSPMYNATTQALYNEAVNDTSSSGRVDTIGVGHVWQEAKYVAWGDYTGTGHNSLLVVWEDGEVDAYDNPSAGQLRGETRLADKGSVFTDAIAISGAGITTGHSDLVVLWKDGELTLYSNVEPSSKFSHETQLQAKGSEFKYARHIAVGNFGSGRINDMFVQWMDGEATIYAGMSTHMGREITVAQKGSPWQYASQVSAGNFPGLGWSLLTRYVDGELDLNSASYSGLGPDHTLIAEHNDVWSKYNTALTTGSFTASADSNSVVAMWVDGEVDMYPYAGVNGLGAEQRLVDK